MDKVVVLTEKTENQEIKKNDLGMINQMIFKTESDVLYHLYRTQDKITIEKRNDAFSWIICKTSDEVYYYSMHIIEPLHYE